MTRPAAMVSRHVPREANRRTTTPAAIPPGHVDAFAALGMALGVKVNTSQPGPVGWLPWEVVPRASGYHVARESAGGTAREFALNSLRKVKHFRSHQRALETAQQLQQEAACPTA